MAKQKLKHPGKRGSAAADASGTPVARALAPPAAASSAKARPAKHKSKAKVPGKAKVAHKAGAREADASTKATAKDASLKATATKAGAAKGGLAKLIHKLPRRPKSLGRLERLEVAVDEVRRGSRTSSRTKKLQAAGIPKMAQKVIEEAGEVALEATQGNRTALVHESVDLLYNLVVLLGACEVPLEALWTEMDRREMTLGMAEKLPKAFDPDG